MRQKITRRLGRRECPRQHQAKTIGAKMIEILASLAARSPKRQQALDHLRSAQAPLAKLTGNFSIDNRSRAAAVKMFQKNRHPTMRRDRSKTNLVIKLKIQPSPHPRGLALGHLHPRLSPNW